MRTATDDERALCAEQLHFELTDKHVILISEKTDDGGRHRFVCVDRAAAAMLQERFGEEWGAELDRRADEIERRDRLLGVPLLLHRPR